MKLRHQQLLGIAIPSLVIILGVMLINSRVIEPRLYEQYQRETVRELDLHAVQLRRIMDRAKAQLRAIAQSPVMRGGDVPTIVSALKDLDAQTLGPFAAIAFCDSRLSVHADDMSTYSLAIPTFQEDLDAGRDIVTDVYYSRTSNQPVFLVLVPITGPADEKIGFVLGEIPVTDSWSASPPGKTPQTSELILQVANDQFLTPDNMTLTSNVAASRYATRAMNFMLPQTRRAANFMLLQTRFYDANSVQFRASVPTLTWQVVKQVHHNDIYGPTRLLRNLMIAMTLLGMGVSLALAWWQSRSLSNRLHAVKESLQRFAGGNSNIRLPDPTNDEIGQVAEAFNCLAEDVTHAQGKLRKQLAEHETVAHDRRQYVEELQTKANDLERFTAAAAHDLKAPLVTMQGFVSGLEAAAKEGAWDRFHGDVARIQRTGDALQAMLQSLLEYARLGQSKTVSEAVSLHQAATDAVELLRGPIERAHVEVIVSPDLPTVMGDPILWRRVFQNLIDNAVKASAGAAAPRIEIGCEQRGGETLCFVRDQGVGLDAEDLTLLFQPFFSGSGQNSGSGIGLPLVKRIVELHGGKIWGESGRHSTGTMICWTVVRQPEKAKTPS